jgi:predicted PurR-regulated permease PerM
MRPSAVQLQTWAIWIGLIVVLVLLRHLFPIIFLTFVLSYFANTAVNALTRRLPRRRLNVVLVYAVFLALIAGLLLMMVPRVLNEARNVARQYIATESAREAGQENAVQREAREMVDSVIIAISGHQQFAEFRTSDAYNVIVGKIDAAAAEGTARVVGSISTFTNAALSGIVQFALSILLSFILIWDLPATAARMRTYSEGRTADIYRAITPSITAFSRTLGRAFEAQSIVAIVNAALSSIVFLLLGLPSIALLATIVFVCSYIPIVGMIVSTVPAAFLALKAGGLPYVLWLVAGIVVMHVVEAYLLNPIIYGRHLKLHPLTVLVILLVAEHLFGTWGLILGVPVAAFFFEYVIRGNPPRAEAVAIGPVGPKAVPAVTP